MGMHSLAINSIALDFYSQHDPRLKLTFGSIGTDQAATVKSTGTWIRELHAGPEITDLQEVGGTDSS